MFVEGKGFIAPQPVRIMLGTEETKFVRLRSQMIAEEKGYNYRNTFMGFLGEAAFGKYIYRMLGIQRGCNLNVLDEGDGGIDFELAGQRFQIKTHKKSGHCLIKRIVRGRLRPLEDVGHFIFIQMNSDMNSETQEANLLGWISIDDLTDVGALVKRGGHYYTQINEKYLSPMERLVKYLNVKLKLEQM